MFLGDWAIFAFTGLESRLRFRRLGDSCFHLWNGGGRKLQNLN